jgi:hypothetical protein
MQARPRRHADALPWGNYVIGVGELRDRRTLNWGNYVIADKAAVYFARVWARKVSLSL